MPGNSESINGGAFLKGRREALGLSLREAGSRAVPPIPSGHLSQIEIGKIRGFNLRLLPQLAAAYDITIPQILEAYGKGMNVNTPTRENAEALRVGKLVLSLPDDDRDNIIGFAQFLQRKVREAT